MTNEHNIDVAALAASVAENYVGDRTRVIVNEGSGEFFVGTDVMTNAHIWSDDRNNAFVATEKTMQRYSRAFKNRNITCRVEAA